MPCWVATDLRTQCFSPIETMTSDECLATRGTAAGPGARILAGAMWQHADTAMRSTTLKLFSAKLASQICQWTSKARQLHCRNISTCNQRGSCASCTCNQRSERACCMYQKYTALEVARINHVHVNQRTGKKISASAWMH